MSQTQQIRVTFGGKMSERERFLEAENKWLREQILGLAFDSGDYSLILDARDKLLAEVQKLKQELIETQNNTVSRTEYAHLVNQNSLLVQQNTHEALLLRRIVDTIENMATWFNLTTWSTRGRWVKVSERLPDFGKEVPAMVLGGRICWAHRMADCQNWYCQGELLPVGMWYDLPPIPEDKKP